MLLVKKCHFFLYLDLVNIRLEIMVNYFEETKETFLTIKNRIFQSPKDRIFFSNGPNPCFWPKNAICFFVRFDQNNTSNNAF